MNKVTNKDLVVMLTAIKESAQYRADVIGNRNEAAISRARAHLAESVLDALGGHPALLADDARLAAKNLRDAGIETNPGWKRGARGKACDWVAEDLEIHVLRAAHAAFHDAERPEDVRPLWEIHGWGIADNAFVGGMYGLVVIPDAVPMAERLKILQCAAVKALVALRQTPGSPEEILVGNVAIAYLVDLLAKIDEVENG